MPRSYYRALGDGRYESTELTQGAWSPDEQHMAVATGLMVHELERVPGGEGKRLSRVSLDILGMIYRGECTIRTRVIRPGRRVELLEAEWESRGRPTIVARGWRLAMEDTSTAVGIEDPPMPGPDTVETSSHMDVWGGKFVRSLDYRVMPGWRLGAGRVWVRARPELVADEPVSTLARLMAIVDVANGLAPRVSPKSNDFSFPNVDLQLHLFREPTGEWLGLDVKQQYGPDGVGLTSTVLHDLEGPFGRAEQILLVRPGGH